GCAGSKPVAARDGDERAAVVGSVAGDVDHAPKAAIAAAIEQGFGKIKRARNRGARGTTIRRARDLVRERIGGLRSVDQPPWHDDLLVVGSRPFEIGRRHFAVLAAAQRLPELPRRDAGDLALA